MATWESVNVKHVARGRTEPGALVVEDEDMVGGWEATVAERGAGSRMLSSPICLRPRQTVGYVQGFRGNSTL